MAAICVRCSRPNPAEAIYCYFDGIPLPGKSSDGPLKAGAVAFSSPFVFPNGLTCVNFNQLVMGCQKNWELAREFLAKGYWTEFMRGVGRHDLAAACQIAANASDKDQALHQFLGMIPSEIMQPPRLSVEPTLLNLGQIRPGVDSRFELNIVNQGMRLLSGTVSSDSDWLVLGPGNGANQIAFQTAIEQQMSVRVVGRNLRAGNRQLVANLSVQSNGGDLYIEVRGDVPILPFPHGLFAAAVTPREIALRAKQHPIEAAELFELGAVEAWYKSNGWDYPVQGPTGSGVGAVQQFFEALGLTKPPVVEIDNRQIALAAKAGEAIRFALNVKSIEKRPVFATASSSQPWLVVGKPVYAGNIVTLPFEIPVIPDRPGETIRAMATVRSNGNQRFLVPVLIEVRHGTRSQTVLKPDEATTQYAKPASLPVVELVGDPKQAKATPIEAPPAPPETNASAFGMGRLVYWSGIAGGWSAFLGWLVGEIFVQRFGQGFTTLLFQIVLVSAAVGGGLSLVGGLTTRQWRGAAGKLIVGLLGGIIAGIIGALVGSFFYNLFGPRHAVLGIVGRVLGWVLLGSSLGAADGLIRRDSIKLRNGIIGGTIGGILGGLLFDPIVNAIGSGLSSRAIGFVVLGFCVGLFIGLVQVILKEGWLIVEAGFRPGRQILLGREAITLGTSEKSSLIFIAYGSKGVEPIHVRIEKAADGRFVLDDQKTRTGTAVNGQPAEPGHRLRDGDLIEFGVNRVRFHERATAM